MGIFIDAVHRPVRPLGADLRWLRDWESVSHEIPGVPRAFIGCCEPVERHVALWGSIVEYDGGCFYFLVEVVEVFS